MFRYRTNISYLTHLEKSGIKYRLNNTETMHTPNLDSKL